MSESILRQICEAKKIEIERQKALLPLDVLKNLQIKEPRISFKDALSNSHRNDVRIIAEIKKASPSRGVFVEDFDPARYARQYKEGGASAISVLTEQNFFLGNHDYLAAAKRASGLPILCKDFIIDTYQVYFARHMGADAILLIAALLPVETMKEYLKLAKELDIDCLVEAHNEEELAVAISAGADIIGINNRNLNDFSVSLETAEGLSSIIPESVVRVAESGLFAHKDISRLQKSGYNNFLIGESLMTSDDPVSLLHELRGLA
ncbi:MAG: indole-3-glycerol phosphate synthase TrpC [candidate division Zixibacteria bacterium]|nr:indole-3-glycerol phosphate synthase TrpC [candidate division Zixibacteria bacterium]